MALTVNLRAECVRQKILLQPRRGCLPQYQLPPPRARGAGLVCSVAAAAVVAAPGLSGSGLLAAQGSGGSESVRPWGDPAEAAVGMEEASSGTGAAGDGFPPQPSSLQLGWACSKHLRGGRGLRLRPDSCSRRTRRAQRGNS